ncbi:hypothetical protein [Mucilaginibacter sp. HD30]
MNKRVLIISPYFAPLNTADMQRVRTSLPYFALFGWDAEIVIVDEQYADVNRDDLLLQSVPPQTRIHKVAALKKNLTAKLGLGSIALRSLWYYKQKVNELLAREKYDLIYFSTTQFPVSTLGAYWKKRFGVPYIIDMQDPWHSDFYQGKPKAERPRKYWFSYRLNKYLEPVAMHKVDGLISVSAQYIESLKTRYPNISSIPAATITFGAFEPDLQIAAANKALFAPLLQDGFINVVYIGRGGKDMQGAIEPVFAALQKGLQANPALFRKLKFYFIGTSYAAAGKGIPTISPLAKQYGVEDSVVEITDRFSYYHALATLQQADALFIPGSTDPQYTASKIYPYMLLKKPLLAIMHEKSSAVEIISECSKNGQLETFSESRGITQEDVYRVLEQWASGTLIAVETLPAFDAYSSRNLTRLQTDVFNLVIDQHAATN